MTATLDLPTTRRDLLRSARGFGRSLFIRHLDAGSDGAAESEVLALGNPYYDLHRLGFFFTASPRHADVLLVTGGVTPPLAGPLRAAFEAMPEPRAVIAAGTAACGGGIERPEVTAGGVDRVVPVDIYCPGDPPTPLMLLHALLLAVGRVEQRLGRGVDRS
ncbi:MAG: NADH-quinone oxidoreductase subunit B family protein [Candidatus Dormibacteraceae bacterium]